MFQRQKKISRTHVVEKTPKAQKRPSTYTQWKAESQGNRLLGPLELLLSPELLFPLQTLLIILVTLKSSEPHQSTKCPGKVSLNDSTRDIQEGCHFSKRPDRHSSKKLLFYILWRNLLLWKLGDLRRDLYFFISSLFKNNALINSLEH